MKRMGSLINKLMSAWCAILLLPASVAATDVSGIISTDTTWTTSNSPYVVTGNVLVSSDVALTIEPGVTVKFDSGLALQIDGTLIARGTSTDYITFTSNQPTPAAGDWGYIFFKDTSADATFDVDGNYTGGSILEYSIVEYGGSLDYGVIRIDDALPFVSRCTIQNNAVSGIYAADVYGYSSYYDTDCACWIKSYATLISNCTISNNSGKGIEMSGISRSIRITGNIIDGNLGGGIDSGGWGGSTITNNIIINNTGYGVDAEDSEISNNIIVNNGSNLTSCNNSGGVFSKSDTITGAAFFNQ